MFTKAPVLALVLAAALVTSCDSKNASNSDPKAASDDLFSPVSINDFGLRGTKRIALTFDDGPGSGTADILSTLKRYNIRATFFVLGKMAREYPDLMRRIAANGHIVANHSYRHSRLNAGRYLKPGAIIQDLSAVHDAIAPYQNPNLGKYFRAPYGAWLPQHATSLNANPVLRDYIGPIFWDIGGQMSSSAAADWACWGQRLSVSRCLAGYLNETNSKQGGVVLFHDITSQSAAMVREYIPEVIRRGYTFVTLDDLGQLSRYRPGGVRSARAP
jgi:peptidoglycan/xylan/chitin deacetylase (PgdA/CDA1 family)